MNVSQGLSGEMITFIELYTSFWYSYYKESLKFFKKLIKITF